MEYTTIDVTRFVTDAVHMVCREHKIDSNVDINILIEKLMSSKNDANNVRVDTDILPTNNNDSSGPILEEDKPEPIEETINVLDDKQLKIQAKEAEKLEKIQAQNVDLITNDIKPTDTNQSKEAEKQSKIQAKEAEKQAKIQAKEAEKQAKIQAKEAEKQTKIQAKEAEKLAKEVEKLAKKQTNGKRGRPKKDNSVVATGDYIESVQAQNVDLISNLANDINTTDMDDEPTENVQVRLFEYDGVMYYKSDDHVLYDYTNQDEFGMWDPIDNEIVMNKK